MRFSGKMHSEAKKSEKHLAVSGKRITFAPAFKQSLGALTFGRATIRSKKLMQASLFARLMVPWMSGLVNGLQNRLRRFESARHLARRTPARWSEGFFFYRAIAHAYNAYSSSSKRCWISLISSSSNHFESFSLALAMISGSMPVHTFFRT